MTAAQRGVLLLCAALNDGQKPLTMAQFRNLSLAAQAMGRPDGDPLRELRKEDLNRLGYAGDDAGCILALLAREETLDAALAHAEQQGIHPLTRISAAYPTALARKLGVNCPPVLFFRGDATILHADAVAVIGSRQLTARSRDFARTAGRLIAEAGLVLVSGGAEGADSEAQEACLEAGGRVLVYVPDRLTDHPPRKNVLYVSEGGFDLAFSTPRAMNRNRLIHVTGDKVLVAQCRKEAGGTWHGSLDNLKHGFSPVFVLDHSGDGAEELCARGATPIHTLTTLDDLEPLQTTLF